MACLKGKAMVKKTFKKPIQEKEKADGWTSTAKPYTEEDQNDGQKKCSRCGNIGEVIVLCLLVSLKVKPAINRKSHTEFLRCVETLATKN